MGDKLKIVPEEPTREMIMAAYNRDRDGTTNLYCKTWAEMIGAATKPPPGLLLSLGDGSAVEATEEQIARILAGDMADAAVHNGDGTVRPFWQVCLPSARNLMTKLIQQAQEARDVGAKTKPPCQHEYVCGEVTTYCRHCGEDMP